MASTGSLKTYRQKRDFQRTQEPQGKASISRDAFHFVVQKHAASRLHYDFRLELDGVLLSWAVPKGPSLNPADRRLAVHVEDHPIEYEDFEGVIPKGEYGGGTVMLWDRGEWEPEGDPRQAYQKGHLKFQLKGQRLQGGWSLVRSSGDDKNWLLIKRKDRHAGQVDIVAQETRSVASGRTMAAIAKAKDRVWSGEMSAASPVSKATDLATLSGAKPAAMPKTIEPEKATLAEAVPQSDDWLYELKYDGYRIVAFLEDGEIRLVSRTQNDWTEKFGKVRDSLRPLRAKTAILDGEIVALDEAGGSSFQALQAAVGDPTQQSALAYYLFDIVYLDGYDLTQVPLRQRKELLAQLLAPVPENGMIRYSDHLVGKGPDFFDFSCRSGQEGIICKLATSPYRQKRTRDWLKIKCTKRQEFVIGGYTAASGSRDGFGALLLGVYEGKLLRYCGKVGTGFSQQELGRLTAKLQPLQRPKPPFHNPPRQADVTWIEPELVAEVAFTEWTQDGHLRHPSFKGLREDKPPAAIRKEEPIPPPEPEDRATRSRTRRQNPPPRHKRNRKVEIAGVSISNPERVLYPEEDLTKQALAEYYEAISSWMLPHLAHRPLMVLRCPQGRGDDCFYQKHLSESVPDAVQTVTVKEQRKVREYLYIEDLGGLISLVQLGTLEFHPWGSQVGEIESPDRLVFDLDPDEGVEWPRVVTAAHHLHELMAALGLTSFVKTTGGKGLHVMVPLRGALTWDLLKAFSGAVVRELAQAYPSEYVATMSKRAREGKIFVDYFRNGRGATAIAAYSTRARPGATVAVPLAWEELSPDLDRTEFNARDLPLRMATMAADPWAGFFQVEQTLTQQALRAVGAES